MTPSPFMVKSRSWLTRSVLAGTIALLVVLLTQSNFLQLGVLQRLELATIDYRFETRGQSRAIPDSSPVVIVEISEDSFKSLPEKFPWPRSYYARLVRNLRAAGARTMRRPFWTTSPGTTARR